MKFENSLNVLLINIKIQLEEVIKFVLNQG